MPLSAIDPREFRQVLGQYPTGVCVVTAMHSGNAAGMVVGSFTSVSLDPPLVAFFPHCKSRSGARLVESARFCVNILSAEQEEVCRKLASRDPDKFADISFGLSPGGSPVIDGAVAWIDCELHSIAEAGDHFFVMGLVRQLDIAAGGLPLLFFQGGYGRFAPSSIVTSETRGLLTEQLRIIDRARPDMERLAANLCAQCLATTRVGDELVFAASAGQASRGASISGVGRRLPFVPPIGFVFAAWLSPESIERWLNSSATEATRDRFRIGLATVRKRGYSVWLLNDAQRALDAKLELSTAPEATHTEDVEKLIQELEFEPAELSDENCAAIRMVTAPIFDGSGNVALALSISGFPKPFGRGGIRDYTTRLLKSAAHVTSLLGG